MGEKKQHSADSSASKTLKPVIPKLNFTRGFSTGLASMKDEPKSPSTATRSKENPVSLQKKLSGSIAMAEIQPGRSVDEKRSLTPLLLNKAVARRKVKFEKEQGKLKVQVKQKTVSDKSSDRKKQKAEQIPSKAAKLANMRGSCLDSYDLSKRSSLFMNPALMPFSTSVLSANLALMQKQNLD
jgi:hypothetical protein